jgi:hypothetical protein
MGSLPEWDGPSSSRVTDLMQVQAAREGRARWRALPVAHACEALSAHAKPSGFMHRHHPPSLRIVPRKRGLPVEYMVAATESHTVDRQETKIELLTRTARFLEDATAN